MAYNNSIHLRVSDELNKALTECFEKVKSKSIRNLSEYVREVLEAHVEKEKQNEDS